MDQADEGRRDRLGAIGGGRAHDRGDRATVLPLQRPGGAAPDGDAQGRVDVGARCRWPGSRWIRPWGAEADLLDHLGGLFADHVDGLVEDRVFVGVLDDVGDRHHTSPYWDRVMVTSVAVRVLPAGVTPSWRATGVLSRAPWQRRTSWSCWSCRAGAWPGQLLEHQVGCRASAVPWRRRPRCGADVPVEVGSGHGWSFRNEDDRMVSISRPQREGCLAVRRPDCKKHPCPRGIGWPACARVGVLPCHCARRVGVRWLSLTGKGLSAPTVLSFRRQ